MLEPDAEIVLLQTLMQLSEIGAPGLLHLGIPGIGRIGPAGVSIGAHLCLNLAVSPCRKLDIIIGLIRAARADAVSGVPRALLDAHLIAKLFKALQEGAPGLFAILALSLLCSMFFCCAGEFDLLLAFAEHPQRVLSRDQLLDLTKGREAVPFDRSIDVQLSRLRRRIEPDPSEPALIKTVRNGGYIFTPEVEPA